MTATTLMSAVPTTYQYVQGHNFGQNDAACASRDQNNSAASEAGHPWGAISSNLVVASGSTAL